MKQVEIYFDEPTHTYTDDEGNVYTSSTQMIGKISQPYDTQYWAVYRILDEKRIKIIPRPDKRIIEIKDPRALGEYRKFTIDELIGGELAFFLDDERTWNTIVKEWEHLATVACDWGNDTHNYLEDTINSFYGQTTKDAEKFEGAMQLDAIKKLPNFKLKITSIDELEKSPLKAMYTNIYNVLYSLVREGFILYAEKRVYSYEHKVSGMIDVLAVKGKEFYIVDWKTNKDPLKFEAGYYKKKWNDTRRRKVKTDEWVVKDDKFLFPLNHLPYCKGFVYTLQLSLYAYICELWGYKCKGLIICHIGNVEVIDDDNNVKKTEKKPVIYNKIKYLKDDIKKLFDWHVLSKEDKANLRPMPNGIRTLN
ncbi:MAG: hypothetical protein COA82_03630 [Alkaliphilus sp.]|nr:MAG: hypothetical protein COA82_03630 [Alkaliphilus sp.]